MRTEVQYSLIALLSIAVCVSMYFLIQNAQQKETEAPVVSASASELRALKSEWATLIAELGAQDAYAQFVRDVHSRPLKPHEQAHAFGEALYDVEGLMGLQYCDASFEFGCYHSFFGVAVAHEGIGMLPQFDQACRDKYGSHNLPCQHGIGHGLLVYTDYENLEDALVLCETISNRPTGGCTSGVFMEYNFRTMGEIKDYIRTPTQNLYEPCDTLPIRFQQSCYFEQVQWWQNVYTNDFKKIGGLCMSLEGNRANYQACYNGIGNYVAAYADFEHDRILSLCNDMPTSAAQGLCHEGASWLVRSEADGADKSRALCEALLEPYSLQCLQKLVL